MLAIIFSGLAFYLYNEFATLSLTKLSVVTASVANTAKRVFVIVAGILMYEDERKKATIYTAVGCFICMAGVGLYACIDDLLKPKVYKVEGKTN
jgi:solute carrier family 35 protein E1